MHSGDDGRSYEWLGCKSGDGSTWWCFRLHKPTMIEPEIGLPGKAGAACESVKIHTRGDGIFRGTLVRAESASHLGEADWSSKLFWEKRIRWQGFRIAVKNVRKRHVVILNFRAGLIHPRVRR